MNLRIRAFGIARDIFGDTEVNFKMSGPNNVKALKNKLAESYPEFEKLRSFAIAVNQEYQEDDFELKDRDEVVVIPPVSGG